MDTITILIITLIVSNLFLICMLASILEANKKWMKISQEVVDLCRDMLQTNQELNSRNKSRLEREEKVLSSYGELLTWLKSHTTVKSKQE